MGGILVLCWAIIFGLIVVTTLHGTDSEPDD